MSVRRLLVWGVPAVLVTALSTSLMTAQQPAAPQRPATPAPPAIPPAAVPQRPATPRTPAPADASGRLVPFGSIKEIMDGLVDPAADVVFEAVVYDITPAGIETKEPKTDEEWAEIRRHGLLLAEASNLLKMPGRRVLPARPFVEFEKDDVLPEDLKPEEIQALIDVDPGAFTRLAQGLADAAMQAVRAADARNVDAIFDAGGELDKACEACHSRYWYPEDKRPAIDALSQRRR